jgi:predicted lactoylglutathione lyase
MIGYVTLGTNDVERAGTFYDPIAEILGIDRIATSDSMIMWGVPGQGAMLCATKPFDKEAATAGNGTMFGLVAQSREQVHQIHDHALANGGSDEGAPGPRSEQFYGGYFRDPDGNKLVVYEWKEG